MIRGDVYYLRFDRSYGHEMAVGRPVVVVSSNERIATTPLVQVVYMTTSERNYDDCFKLVSGYRDSWVCCNQLNTVDKSRLQDFQYHLTDPEMDEIDKRLKMVLGFEESDDVGTECIVEVAEPVDIRVVEANECENTELRVELAMYKKLYEKALEKLIDLKLEKDTRVEKPVIEVCEPMVEESVLLEEEVPVEKPKRGRPPKKKVEVEVEVKVDKKPPYNARRADIEQYKKKSGKVNVNTDEWFVIAATTGMKIATAQGICSYRNKYGEYESIVDLLDVPSFSSTMLDKYGRMLEV